MTPSVPLTLVYALDAKTNELGLKVLPDGTHVPAGELRKAEKELSGNYARLTATSHPAEFVFAGNFPHLPTGPYKVTRETHGPGHREPTIRLEYLPPPGPESPPQPPGASVWERALVTGAEKLLLACEGTDPGLVAGVRELAKLIEGDQEVVVWICLIGYLTAAEREARCRAGQFESLLSLAVKSMEGHQLDPVVPLPAPASVSGRTWWRWFVSR